jgi:hypothetical protein
MALKYTRRFKPGDVGPDVEAVGRALCRSGAGMRLAAFNALPQRTRRTWGWRKRRWLKAFKKKNGLAADGIYGKGAHAKLEPFFDARAKELMRRYEPEIALVEPHQGWGSLDRTLWELYSLGRSKYQLSDLGTYNPASRLPSGGPSDHAVGPPALAFDLGIDPDIGQADPQGHAFFEICMRDRRVEYVILGDKIWSRDRGLHAYTAGGHMNHVHVSGRHSSFVRATLRVRELAEQALA